MACLLSTFSISGMRKVTLGVELWAAEIKLWAAEIKDRHDITYAHLNLVN